MEGDRGVSSSDRERLVSDRRELHRVAEPAWCEVYTASKVVTDLERVGWCVRRGRDVVQAGSRLGLPSSETLEAFYKRALAIGADPTVAAELRDGFTGAVARLTGSRDGPVVAIRFDLDANFGMEATDIDHKPALDGYASTHPLTHHNCAHDGHTALGLALARVMVRSRETLAGELRLIFQPAEEGLRGARAMLAAGVLDDVDYFYGFHIGVQARRVGEVISGYRDLLGSVKLDAHFAGRGAHAAISPHDGRNALIAACVAAQALMAIPRHGSADTRVNVGTLAGGEARNSVPAHAQLSLELRSDTAEGLDYLKDAATRVICAAADMHGVVSRVERAGEACAASSDASLSAVIRAVAKGVPGVVAIRDDIAFKGSDDASEMMRYVQQRGGQAAYFGIGSHLADVHHNPRFDFDEASLPIALDLLVHLAMNTLTTPQARPTLTPLQ